MTISEIETELALLEEQLRVLLNPHPMTATENIIYTQAKLNLGKHLTLNDAVPHEEGCAEAVSKILSLAGISVPSGGIPGTATLYEWLLANPAFEKIEHPEQGAILVSPTGEGNGTVEGHTAICAKFGVQFPNDWGLMSNNSDNGLFQEKWSLSAWEEHYGQEGGLPLYWFRPIGN